MNDYIFQRIKDFGKFFCWAWIDRAYYYLGGVVQPHDYLIEGADGQAVCNEDEYKADFVNMWENKLNDQTRLDIFKDVSGCETDQDVIDFFPPNNDIKDKIKSFGQYMGLDATEKAYHYLGGVVSFHDYAITNAKHGEPDWDEDQYYADFKKMWEDKLTDEQRINILKYVFDLKTDKEVEEFITTQMGWLTAKVKRQK